MEITDNHTISLFLSDSELTERGFDIENHDNNIMLINSLVDEALLFAESTHNFPMMDVPFRTEVAYIPNQGVYITVSFEENQETTPAAVAETDHQSAVFHFTDFEHIIGSAAKLPEHLRNSGELYVHEGKYLLYVHESQLTNKTDFATVKAVLSEYGRAINKSIHVVKAYGKVIFAERALQEIAERFPY